MSDLERALIQVPEHMHESVREYIRVGRPIGDFLTAVFGGTSLVDVARRADELNALCLVGWAGVIYHGLPSNAHGSKEAVKAWIAKGGLEGKPVDA